jgi:predicted Kef-type K+ transport protein
MTIAFILGAYCLGVLAKFIKLPPLVGYLAAGFGLHALGYNGSAELDNLANLGITLMLFTIGLKVNIRDLLFPEFWGSSLSHMLIWVLVCPFFVFGLGTLGMQVFDMSMSEASVLVFALSFSSTVCAIKVLEDAYEIKSRHSNLAISVLIIQDIVAVLFLVFATGKVPSAWALLLLLAIPAKPIFDRLLNFSGHGELLPLLGIVLAVGAYSLFDLMNLKGDLGALAIGMLLASSNKASELYKSLISFKDLFLIAFFLSIGLSTLPTLEMFWIALGIMLILPLKFVLFFALFSLFAFRARTAFLSALILSNFSEFGLIVAALSLKEGLMDEHWLVILAMTVAFSFVFTSVVYQFAHNVYSKYSKTLIKFQRQTVSAKYIPVRAEGAQILVIGMGRVGQGAYSTLTRELGGGVWGVELEADRVQHFKDEGLEKVIVGDADDIEFWEAQDLDSIELIMLAIPSVEEMKNIISQLKISGYQGKISAIARYDDERELLVSLGVDVAFNYYAEVGMGFAEESWHLISALQPETNSLKETKST